MSFTEKFDKEDYYLSPEGFIIFTEKYHLKRGYCCESNCKHCPYKKRNTGREGSDEGNGIKNFISFLHNKIKS